MSNARNLGELLEADGEVPSGKIDSIAASKLTGTIPDARLSAAKQVAKLPLAGGAMTGAITTNSTFDTRDVATDGTKLDTIETSATADQTAAEIKTHLEDGIDSIHYVDGSIDTIHIGDDQVTAAKLANSINTEIAANTAKTGITSGQASAITANTAKTGITSGQASAITANTAKITYPSADSTKLGNIEALADVTDTTNVVAALSAGTGVGISAGGEITVTAVALTTVQTAANQTAHLALTAQEGDIVVRSDENKTYCHNGGSAGTMGDYTLLATPTDAVLSVNGNTGAITAAQIATAVEAASGSNTFTDADHTKLNAITGTNTGDNPGVTSVATSGAITGGTITSTGTITHSTAAGYKHVPTAGTVGQILTNTASGTGTWQDAAISLPSQTTHAGKYLSTDGTTASWGAVTTLFPFYKADGTSDSINITNGTLPFFKADGSADNIGVS